MTTAHPPRTPGPHDPFIQQQLPDWLKHASEADYAHLGQLLSTQQTPNERWFTDAPAPQRRQLQADQARCRRSAAALSQTLGGLQGIVEFCEPLLRARIKRDLGAGLDVNRDELVQFEREPVVRGLVWRTVPRQQTLMQAALQNFPANVVLHEQAALAPKGGLGHERMVDSGEDTDHWGYRFYAKYTRDPYQFTRLCHELDLGGRYQQHLADVFEAAQTQQRVRTQTMALCRDRLRACAQAAFMQQAIGVAAHQALLELLRDQRGARYNGKPLRISQLTMFKVAIAEVLVFSADRLTSDVVEPVIVYWPGAPQPLKEYSSARASQDELRLRLLEPAYRDLLRRHIAQADQQHVFTRLDQALYRQVPDAGGEKRREPRPASRLYLREVPVEAELFGHLQQCQLHKLKADARWLAVPSAEVDEQARKARLAYWQSIALDVLNVAAFFVPGLGEAMALVAVTQVVNEVIVGVEDWEQGDLRQAWEHIAAVGLNLAAAVGLGLAQRAVVRMSRGPLLDSLRRVRLPNGQQRLWKPQLTPYAADVELSDSLPDARGLYRQGRGSYLRVDGRVYEVTSSTDGQWSLCHPRNAEAYPVRLRHNREGLWQIESEQPASWSRQRLLRRLGPLSEGLDDALLEAAMAISGIDEAVLRHTHLMRSPIPPLLKDCLRRIQVYRRFEQLRVTGQAPSFEQLYRAACEVGTADVQRLQRMFPGLPSEAAREVLGHATRQQRRELAEGLGGLPLLVMEEARLYQQQVRLNRAIEGLYLPALAGPDSERLAQGLLESTASLSPALRQSAYERALSDRQAAAQALGQQPIRPWLRPPLRLADGRLGYPMGGVLGTQAPMTWRFNELYPEITAEGVLALMHDLKSSDLATAIIHLEQEYDALEQTLAQWAVHGDVFEVDARRLASVRIKAAWRRTGGAQWRCLDLSGLDVGSLPELDARFAHIRVLKLDDMQLNQSSAAFLRHFPHLRELSLVNNQLDHLPPAIADMNELQQLDVSGNRLYAESALFERLRPLRRLHCLRVQRNGLIALTGEALGVLGDLPALRSLDLHGNFLALDQAQLQCLTQLPLESLNLSANRIRLDAGSAEAFAYGVHLRALDLSFNPLRQAPQLGTLGLLQTLQLHQCMLSEWPAGLTTLLQQNQYQLRFVDLSSNTISSLPALAETRFGADLLAGGNPQLAMHLGENPLDTASIGRLEAVGLNFPHGDFGDVQLGTWLGQADGAQRNLWNALFAGDANRALKGMLERMLVSREYQLHPANVNRRIWNLLQAATEHRALRDELLAVAEGYPVTCGDAGADAFSSLEVAALSFQRGLLAVDSAAQRRNLYDLYRQLFRRAEVQRLADRLTLRRSLRRQALLDHRSAPALDELDNLDDARLLRFQVDDIEIRLGLRQRLASTLDYPEPSRGLLYGELAGISRQTEQQVAAAVRLADNASNRQAWMASDPGWQRYLKQAYAGQFDVLSAFWSEGLDYLDYCLGNSRERIEKLDPSVQEVLGRQLQRPLRNREGQLRKLSLSDQAYREAADALRVAHAESEAGLMLSLTQAQALSG